MCKEKKIDKNECRPLTVRNRRIHKGDKEIAEEFNLYFASVFTKEDMNNCAGNAERKHVLVRS